MKYPYEIEISKQADKWTCAISIAAIIAIIGMGLYFLFT